MVARLLREQEAVGSNPAFPTSNNGLWLSLVRAPHWGCGDRQFNSDQPDQVRRGVAQWQSARPGTGKSCVRFAPSRLRGGTPGPVSGEGSPPGPPPPSWGCSSVGKSVRLKPGRSVGRVHLVPLGNTCGRVRKARSQTSNLEMRVRVPSSVPCSGSSAAERWALNPRVLGSIPSRSTQQGPSSPTGRGPASKAGMARVRLPPRLRHVGRT